jgi:hypothetical protein
MIAFHCAQNANVVGYDLINEPSTPEDKISHWTKVDPEGIDLVLEKYKQMVDYFNFYALQLQLCKRICCYSEMQISTTVGEFILLLVAKHERERVQTLCTSE